MNIIQREDYLRILIDWMERPDIIKIIMGIRRSGKSTLLEQFKKYLEDEGKTVIHINFESKKYDNIQDYKELNQHIEKNVPVDKKIFFLLDEIQNVKGWEKTINSLRIDYDSDIYITGSNGYMLSSELSTLLSGRYVEMQIMPFSFKEYLLMHPPNQNSIEQRFNEYLNNGGMPIIDPNDSEERTNSIFQGICSTILLKDVNQRLNNANPRILNEIMSYLMSNVGNITNISSIAEALSLSDLTVKKYVQGLVDAFLIYECKRFDIRGKKILKSNEKYYCVDNGLRNSIIFDHYSSDIGRLLENVVFLELKRRYKQVVCGSHYDKEIDFVVKKGSEIEYFQVALSILDETTLEREVKPLKSVPDSYPKTILTLDRIFSQPPYGIKAINVIDWLLQ